MPNTIKESVFNLVKSLKKSEKRAFKLFISRSGNPHEMKISKLFDALDKQDVYDEGLLLHKLPEISKSQISNLKAHLYKQILSSLRIIYSGHNPDMQVREMLDYARILYVKGLYDQGLKVLERAKIIAQQNNRYNLHLEILEFEKTIESQFITRSMEDRAETLSHEVNRVLKSVSSIHYFSNLALRLYGLYIKVGPIKNKDEYMMVRNFFYASLGDAKPAPGSFLEMLYYHVAYSWYYYIVQDFPLNYRHTQKWVMLFHQHPDAISQETTWYVKGLHNLLSALFQTLRYEQFRTVLKEFEEFVEKNYDDFNENLKVNSFIYLSTARLNRYLLEGSFREGLGLVKEIEAGLTDFGFKIDNHRVLLFYYKIACLHFGAGNYHEALQYLNRIINSPHKSLREDIQCFSRILSLIIIYELGDADRMEYQIKSVYHFLSRMNDVNAVQKEILSFLKRSGQILPHKIKSEFAALEKKFTKLSMIPYEQRPFFYLDIISWLKSKTEGKPLEEIVRRRFEAGFKKS